MSEASGRGNDPLREARLAAQAGRFRDAWAALERAPEHARVSVEGRLLTAMTTWRLGNFARSRAAALEARDQFRAAGDVDGEMRSENVAAAGAFALGALEDAERGFTRALTLADQRDDTLMSARCANNLGNVAYYRRQHPAALSFYRLATVNFERLSWPSGLAQSWNNTSIVYRELTDLERARDASERALSWAESAGDHRLLAEVLAGKAETHHLEGDRGVARAQLQRAVKLAREHGDRLAETEALRILAKVELADGDATQSETLGREALGITRALGHPWATAEVERDLGELYRTLGRKADAELAFEAAAAEFTRLGASARAEEMRAQAAEVKE